MAKKCIKLDKYYIHNIKIALFNDQPHYERAVDNGKIEK